MHRYFCASLFIIYLFSSNAIFGFAGRPETVQDVRLYHQAKQDLEVDIFIFKNNSTNKDFDYFSLAIPEIIAAQIELNKKVIVSSNNMKASPIGYENAYDYKILQFTNITYTSNFVNNQLIVATNKLYLTVTNSIKKKENINIIDVNSENLTISSNEILYMYKDNPVILKDNNNFIRDIKVNNSFVNYKGDDIKEYAFTQDSDIVIFGNIDVTRYTVIITAYIAEVHARTLTSFSVEINDFEVENILPLFCIEVANQMNAIEKTGVIGIQTDPPDALLYIDGTYVAKTTDTVYIPSLTVGEHRITIEKNDYKTIDKVFSFQKPLEDLNMDFSLIPLENVGKIIIDVPGGTNTTVIFNGIREPKNDIIEKHLALGTYSIKMINDEYEDYFASILLNSEGEYKLIPKLKKKPEQTLARKIFGNYERNTKIGLGITAAAGLFALSSYIYANEIYDITVIEHYEKYQGVNNPPPLDLDKYNLAYNLYIAGAATSIVFAVASGIFYLLWVSEANFDVEEIQLGYGKDKSFNFNFAVSDGAMFSFSKRF